MRLVIEKGFSEVLDAIGEDGVAVVTCTLAPGFAPDRTPVWVSLMAETQVYVGL